MKSPARCWAGKRMEEALFKGLTAAGIRVPQAGQPPFRAFVRGRSRPLRSGDAGQEALRPQGEDVRHAHTAQAIRQLGIDVTEIPDIGASGEAFELIESGRVSYVVYTGALRDDTCASTSPCTGGAALARSIACLTSLDTANALADILKSRYNERNTELVDLCHMRARRSELRFAKMQCAGTDYIVIDNRDFSGLLRRIAVRGRVRPALWRRRRRHRPHRTKRHRRREDAHVQPRRQSRRHGGRLSSAGGQVPARPWVGRGRGEVTIEAGGGVKRVQLFLTDGKVTSARVDMGEVVYEPARVPWPCPVRKWWTGSSRSGGAISALPACPWAIPTA